MKKGEGGVLDSFTGDLRTGSSKKTLFLALGLVYYY